MQHFVVQVANELHLHHADTICNEMESSAKARGTGIAKRTPDYIRQKMSEGKAVIAGYNLEFVWLCRFPVLWPTTPFRCRSFLRSAYVALGQPAQ